jgi:hypothetical protein
MRRLVLPGLSLLLAACGIDELRGGQDVPLYDKLGTHAADAGSESGRVKGDSVQHSCGPDQVARYFQVVSGMDGSRSPLELP